MEQPKESQERVIEPEVQIMSREERDSFKGITIEPDSGPKDSAGNQSGARTGIYIKHYNWTPTSWVTKIMVGLLLLAVISGAVVIGGGLLVFIILGWLISRLFRR